MSTTAVGAPVVRVVPITHGGRATDDLAVRLVDGGRPGIVLDDVRELLEAAGCAVQVRGFGSGLSELIATPSSLALTRLRAAFEIRSDDLLEARPSDYFGTGEEAA